MNAEAASGYAEWIAWDEARASASRKRAEEMFGEVETLTRMLADAKLALIEADGKINQLRSVVDAKEAVLQSVRAALAEGLVGLVVDPAFAGSAGVASWSIPRLVARTVAGHRRMSTIVEILDVRATAAENAGQLMSPLEIRYVMRHPEEFGEQRTADEAEADRPPGP